MATAKQLAALKKARAARKKNLAKKTARKAPAKKTVARKKPAVRKNPVKRKAPAKRKTATKRAAPNTGVVYAQRTDAGKKYYYTGLTGKAAFDSDRTKAVKVGPVKAMQVAKQYIGKMPQGYGIHYTGKKR